MLKSIYITGFKNEDITKEELDKLKEYKNKYKDLFIIIDKRDAEFEDVSNTFKAENKNIVLYSEITSENIGNKDKIIEVATELKKLLPNINIEVNDEEKELL